MDSGADAGLACEVPQTHDPLRAARGHPRGFPPSGLFVDLPQLLILTVLKGSLNTPCFLKMRFVPVCFWQQTLPGV